MLDAGGRGRRAAASGPTPHRPGGTLLPRPEPTEVRRRTVRYSDGGVLALAVQRGLQLRLGLLAQRGLEDEAAVATQGRYRLVRRDLLDQEEERRGSRLHQVPDLRLEGGVDARLLQLP